MSLQEKQILPQNFTHIKGHVMTVIKKKKSLSEIYCQSCFEITVGQ